MRGRRARTTEALGLPSPSAWAAVVAPGNPWWRRTLSRPAPKLPPPLSHASGAVAEGGPEKRAAGGAALLQRAQLLARWRPAELVAARLRKPKGGGR